MYSLCGLGPSCAIATGTASVARGRLVRREILELALYTFKYVPGMQSVIAFMPPKTGSQPQYVVYLQKSDLSQELKLPLARHAAREDAAPEQHPGARGDGSWTRSTDPKYLLVHASRRPSSATRSSCSRRCAA